MSAKQSHKRLRIGIVGAGNMGASIARGLVNAGFDSQNILVMDLDAKKTKKIKAELNIKLVKANRQLASICDVIILAVKPQALPAVLDEISHGTPRTVLVISIAAGIRLKDIQKSFKEEVPVIRAMPNMPALVGEGMTAYAMGRHTNPKHKVIADQILKSFGEVVEVKENALDLVTAVSGSGPAYFFLMAEKMIEAACEMGLKADVAKTLVYQTALGSAKVMLSEKCDPDEWVSRVASKGGTTEAALKVFKRKGFGKIMGDAIQAAHKRSKELSESSCLS